MRKMFRKPSERRRESSSTPLCKSVFWSWFAPRMHFQDTLKAVEGQKDVGDAIAQSQKSLEGHLGRLSQDRGATSGGIQFSASQLSGFKTEVTSHLKGFAKLFEGVSWDWVQDAKFQTPMHQWIKTTFGHLTKKLDEVYEVNVKSKEHQAQILGELQKNSTSSSFSHIAIERCLKCCKDWDQNLLKHRVPGMELWGHPQ